jgi:cytochrome c553
MWHHFWDVSVAREAVIKGEFDAARAPLLRVARSDQPEPLPQEWLPWMGEMRAEAAKAADAKTLPEMAAVVSAVSVQCAECHRATRGGPGLELQTDDLAYGHPDRGFSDAMKRHAWAADELWLGMTVPSHSSWIRGARALGEFPVPGMEEWDAARRAAQVDAGPSSSAPPQKLEPVMVEKLRKVRALGQRAEAAGKPFEQQAIFSELLTMCGDCHRALPPVSTVAAR